MLLKRSQYYHCLSLLLCLVISAMASARPGGLTDVGRLQIYGWQGEDPAISVIPFSRAGNLMLVKARADSVEGNFILDTGAPHLVLNLTYFRDHPATISDAEQTSITGTGGQVQRTSIASFNLGKLHYYRTDADLVNLAHIENVKGVKVLGLLGMALFRDCELIIDFDKDLLYLRRISKRSATAFSSEQAPYNGSYLTFPFELTDNRIMAKLEMGGRKMKFIIDCAAESNILDSRLPAKLLDQVSVTGRVLLNGSGSRKLEALTGRISGLKLEAQDLGEMPVLITNLEKTCFSYSGCIDGILGFDFMSRQKIGFNFVTRKMYIWK